MSKRNNAELAIAWLSNKELTLGMMINDLGYTALGVTDWNEEYSDWYFIFHESRREEIKKLDFKQIQGLAGIVDHEYTMPKRQPKTFYFVRGTSPNRKGTVWQSNLFATKGEIDNLFSKQLEDGVLELLTAIV